MYGRYKIASIVTDCCLCKRNRVEKIVASMHPINQQERRCFLCCISLTNIIWVKIRALVKFEIRFYNLFQPEFKNLPRKNCALVSGDFYISFASINDLIRQLIFPRQYKTSSNLCIVVHYVRCIIKESYTVDCLRLLAANTPKCKKLIRTYLLTFNKCHKQVLI